MIRHARCRTRTDGDRFSNAGQDVRGIRAEVTAASPKQPVLVDGHVRMGIAKYTEDVHAGCQIVTSFPLTFSPPCYHSM